MALALMPISLLAAPGVFLCLGACIAFSASMLHSNLKKLKPLSALALGLVVFWVLGFSLPGGLVGTTTEGPTYLPILMVQIAAAVNTAASAWIASAWLFRNHPVVDDQKSQDGPVQSGEGTLKRTNYPRPPQKQRPPMRDEMKVFLSCFLPAVSGWVAVLTLFLILSMPTTGSRWTELLWSLLWLPVLMTISLTTQGVWLFLLACFAFGVSMISPMLRRFKAVLSAVLSVVVYFLVEAENLEGFFRGLSGRLPETAPLFLLQVTAALVTGGAAWITTAKLFPYEPEARESSAPLAGEQTALSEPPEAAATNSEAAEGLELRP